MNNTGIVNLSKGIYLNVREEGSFYGNVIGTLAPNSKIEIIDTVGEWYEISFNNSTAYVYSTAIKVSAVKKEGIKISTGIPANYGFNTNIGNQPTVNWNARVIANQIQILNAEGTAMNGYWTSNGDHISIIKIDSTTGLTLIQYPDQGSGIYQQGWILTSEVNSSNLVQTFDNLWTNSTNNQTIYFYDGAISSTTLSGSEKATFLYIIFQDSNIYACIEYLNSNNELESGFVPWESGTLNMIGPNIPYHIENGTSIFSSTPTFASNATTEANSIQITDINGISIPNSCTSNGDNITILRVYAESGMVLIEYPCQAVNAYYKGYVAVENLDNGNISINSNTANWNNSNGNYPMYGISTNDLLYTLPASQACQYLYQTGDYACILFNNNNISGWPLQTGYTSTSNGQFSRN